jgi:hypothetical protein
MAYERNDMKRKHTFARYRPSKFLVQPSLRHSRMLRGSRGWVGFSRRPESTTSSRRLRGPKKVWLRPRSMSLYLGCTRRHLYWLIRYKRFPYYWTGSVNSPRYVFEVGEVNKWLSGYRGKGRTLGLRRLEFGKNPRAPWLTQKGPWNHP